MIITAIFFIVLEQDDGDDDDGIMKGTIQFLLCFLHLKLSETPTPTPLLASLEASVLNIAEQ